MIHEVGNAEVWWCELPDIGRRPVVVLSRDVAIVALGRAMVAPCTTTVRNLPSEVVLERGVDPVPRDCVINLDSVESVGVGSLVERLGRLSGSQKAAVCRALAIAADCPSAM
ncbi:MAG: type II toxin-antitoxin system PemK/MazF family toxin [Euzebya sp.]